MLVSCEAERASRDPRSAAMIATRLDRFFSKLERRDIISPEEREALLAAAGQETDVAAGQDLVREGDRPDHSTLVVSGSTTRYRVLGDGQRQITALHVPGDFVDLHSFALKEMDHSVGALSISRVIYFPHSALTVITERFPHLTRVLWLMTLLDGAIHREWLVAMGRRAAAGQLAHLVCELYIRLNIVGLAQDYSFSVPLTQVELAVALGFFVVFVFCVLLVFC